MYTVVFAIRYLPKHCFANILFQHCVPSSWKILRAHRDVRVQNAWMQRQRGTQPSVCIFNGPKLSLGVCMLPPPP